MSQEVGKLYIQFDADGRPYIQGLKDIDRRTQQFQRDQQGAFDRLGGKLGMAIETGMAIGATAVVAGGALITRSLVKTAASYQYEMSRIKAVTKATESEMKAMGDAAVKLGADAQFSAGEAAQGMNELAKAGVSVGDILGGGIQGTLALAAAGELEVGRAAEVAANAMNVFSLKGQDVSMVADTLSAAANKSSVDVTDLADSLAMSGAIAANAGWSIQETVAALAELGNAGVKGSDAGTSLKQMLLSLQGPSDIAAQTMADLGISVYDAAGEMVSAQDVIANLEAATADLTDQERDYALEKIFGSDAVRAANVLIKQGAKGYGDMATAVSEAGEAERVAKTKMDNFQGSVEELRGSIETLLIRGGSPLIEWLRGGVDWLTDATNWAGNFLEGLEGLSGWEGADITGKIKIAWSKLEEDFTAWFEGMNPIPAKVYPVFTVDESGHKRLDDMLGVPQGVIKAEIEFVESRDTGEEKLMAMGAKIGRGAADFLLAVLGETDSDSVWARAGEALAEGFWQAFKKGLQLSPDERADFQGKVGRVVTPDESTNAGKWSTGGSNLVQSLDYLLGLAGMGKIDPISVIRNLFSGSDVKNELDAQGEATGAAMGDAMVVPLTSRVSAAILGALGVTSEKEAAAKALGTAGGQGYADGFTAAVQARLNNWQLTAQNFFYKADRANGAAIGGGMTDAELMGLLGISAGGPGDTGGLKPQTQAFWGALHGAFPFTDLISGYRANDAYPDHPSGTAIDITVPGMRKDLGNAVANWAIDAGARYVIWNRQTWYPWGNQTYSHNAEDPHTSHLHIRTYDAGGVLEPGVTLASNWTGSPEVIVPASLTADIDALIAAIRVLVNADTDIAEGLKGQERDRQVLAEFADRMGLSESYTSREQARYGMMEAQGADDAALAEQLGVVLTTLNDSVAEAQAQLDAAKELGLPQEEINALATDLFNLRGEVADTEQELADLTDTTGEAAQALKDAADAFDSAIGQAGSLLDILGNASSDIGGPVRDYLMGLTQGSYQNNLALMNSSTDLSDIAGYGSAAIGDINSMFGQEVSAVGRALDATQQNIDDAQSEYEDAWQLRADAAEKSVSATIAALERQQTRMRETHQAELDEIRTYYDDQLAALSQSNDDLSRERARAAARDDITSLQAELQTLLNEEGKTASDVDRIEAIRKQLAKAKVSAAEQEAAWAVEDQRTELERQRDAALASLTEQQKAEEASLERRISTAQAAADIQREALEAERKAQLAAYEQQRKDAQQARDNAVNDLVNRYAAMVAAVMAGEAQLTGLYQFEPPTWLPAVTAGSAGKTSAGGMPGVILGGGVDNGWTAATGGASAWGGQSAWDDLLAADNMAKWGNPFGRYYGTKFWRDTAKPTQEERWTTGTGSGPPVEVKVSVSGDGTTLTAAQVEDLKNGVIHGVVAEMGRRQHNARYFN